MMLNDKMFGGPTAIRVRIMRWGGGDRNVMYPAVITLNMRLHLPSQEHSTYNHFLHIPHWIDLYHVIVLSLDMFVFAFCLQNLQLKELVAEMRKNPHCLRLLRVL